MNPAALMTNLADLIEGRHPDRQRRRVRRERPRAGRLRQPIRWKTAAWTAISCFRSTMTRLTRLAVEELGLGQKESDRCRNFYAMGLVFWLYDRLARADAALHRRQIRQDARQWPKPTAGPCTPATTMAKRPRPLPAIMSVAKAKLPPGTYRNITGNQAHGLGPDRGRRAERTASCSSASYPITPASDILHELIAVQEFRRAHVPGRRRNRRRHLGHRRRVRRRDGGDHFQRAGHRAEARRHRPGRDDRAAAADHQRAARRPEHRPADQDRASRSAASHVAAATANAPCRCWPRKARPIASTSPKKPGGSPSAT